MARRTKHAAVSVIMLGFGRSRLRIRRGRHFSTDRRHVEGVGGSSGDNAKCRDRRNQLHQYREQHDWNKYFQPPSHDFPRNALLVLPFVSTAVEIARSVASMDTNKFALPEFLLRTPRASNGDPQYALALLNWSPQVPLTPRPGRRLEVDEERLSLAQLAASGRQPNIASPRRLDHGTRLAACFNAGISATRSGRPAEAETCFFETLQASTPLPRCNLRSTVQPRGVA